MWKVGTKFYSISTKLLVCMCMSTVGLQVTVKKVTEESVNKSKQVAELQRNISRLNQFLSSNESKRQVC